MRTKMRCPYCNGKAVLVPISTVYHTKKFKVANVTKKKIKTKMWVCENYPECDSYVGCHPGTEIPLGRLANLELRLLKIEAHKQFDPIWKSGLMTRKQAYEWLADMLDMSEKECHIGMFSPEMCRKVIKVCQNRSDEEIEEYCLKHYDKNKR